MIFSKREKLKKKNSVTSLSNYALNNLNKNSLWIAQKVKLVEQMSVKINNAQNAQIIDTLSNEKFSLLYKFLKY